MNSAANGAKRDHPEAELGQKYADVHA